MKLIVRNLAVLFVMAIASAKGAQNNNESLYNLNISIPLGYDANNLPAGSELITGTITTDGATGLLTATDFLAFDITVSGHLNGSFTGSSVFYNDGAGGPYYGVTATNGALYAENNYISTDGNPFTSFSGTITNSSSPAADHATLYLGEYAVDGSPFLGLDFYNSGLNVGAYNANLSNSSVATSSAVPEPSTWAMLAVGGLLFIITRQERKAVTTV